MHGSRRRCSGGGGKGREGAARLEPAAKSGHHACPLTLMEVNKHRCFRRTPERGSAGELLKSEFFPEGVQIIPGERYRHHGKIGKEIGTGSQHLGSAIFLFRGRELGGEARGRLTGIGHRAMRNSTCDERLVIAPMREKQKIVHFITNLTNLHVFNRKNVTAGGMPFLHPWLRFLDRHLRLWALSSGNTSRKCCYLPPLLRYGLFFRAG